MKETAATRSLAEFASGLTPAGLPPEVGRRVKLLLIDALASGLTGWTSNEARMIDASARSMLGPGESCVIGGRPLSRGGAAMVNGYLITARSLCDMHQPTLCHVTPVVAPAVLALATGDGSGGPDLLAGLAIGFEATVRIGQALDYPELRSRGWHTTGVVGPIGGAIGGARSIGLDPESTERAIGLAAAHSAGTFAAFGTPTIKFNQARAALGGLMSVEMARDGFLGPTDVLTTEDGGLLGTYSDGGKPGLITDGLGERWELMGITTRLWPSAAALQGVMTIISSEAVPQIGEIARVTVGLPPDNYQMNADMPWSTPFQAQLSARYVTSVALHDRTVWLEQFAPDRLVDPDVSEFAAEKITVREDRSLPEGGVDMAVETRDGAALRWRREQPKGHPDDPVAWEEVSHKLHVAAAGIITDAAVEAILETVDNLEAAADVRPLAGLLGRAS
ncbi:MAG: MmgE/PrpD family protein [Acidimicrobiia bacterium]